MNSASSSVNGYTFQNCAQIVLFLDNIKDVEEIRVEGSNEDIELYLSGSRTIYSQSKCCLTGDSSDISYFKDALRTLSNADSDDTTELIFVTNIVRPLGKKTPVEDFDSTDHWITYSDLSTESKNIIDALIERNGFRINTGKLAFRIIGYKGDPNRTRKEVILKNIDRFTSKFSRTIIDSEQLLTVWISLINANATDANLGHRVSKKSMVWAIIQIQMEKVNQNLEEYDDAFCCEVESLYNEVIKYYEERIDFTSKVLSHYNEWSQGKPKSNELLDSFVEQFWEQYKTDLDATDISDDIKHILVSIILRRIISLRYLIKRIKEQANL